MSTNNELTGLVVVTKAPRLNKDLIIHLKAVHAALLDNPNFPDLSPMLAVFAANIAAFEEAETKAATRVKGAVAFRDAKKKKALDTLGQLRSAVQSVVSGDMTPEDAAAIIESAFMSVKKMPTRSIPEVSAKNGDVSGDVVLACKAAGPAAVYFWEYSVDQSNWTPVPETMKSRTVVSGLTPACVYSFRFRAVTRVGRQDYSHVVSLVVH